MNLTRWGSCWKMTWSENSRTMNLSLRTPMNPSCCLKSAWTLTVKTPIQKP
jgi:hypothetical protein